MIQNVRITSKGQITIPIQFYKSMGLSKGDTLIAVLQDEQMILKKAQKILDEAVGSVKIPDKYKKLSLDEAILQAKKDYFSSKRS